MVANDTGSRRSKQLGPSPRLRLLPIFLSPTSAFSPSSLSSPLPFPFPLPQSYFTPYKTSGAILLSYFKLVPLGASLFLPFRFCLLLLPPLVLTEDLLKVVLGALPGTWHRAQQRCQSFRASQCKLAQVCCPAAWQGCPEAPWGPKGGHACTFPIILEETLSFLLFLSSSLAPIPVCSKAGPVMPASWVSGCRGALPLCTQCLGLLLLPGVVNCSAFVIVTSVFKSSASSLLLPPGSWKLTSCLSDFVSPEPGPSSPRPGDGGPGNRAPPCYSSIVPTSSSWPDLVCFCLLG